MIKTAVGIIKHKEIIFEKATAPRTRIQCDSHADIIRMPNPFSLRTENGFRQKHLLHILCGSPKPEYATDCFCTSIKNILSYNLLFVNIFLLKYEKTKSTIYCIIGILICPEEIITDTFYFRV